jgi:hypothetical protein
MAFPSRNAEKFQRRALLRLRRDGFSDGRSKMLPADGHPSLPRHEADFGTSRRQLGGYVIAIRRQWEGDDARNRASSASSNEDDGGPIRAQSA